MVQKIALLMAVGACVLFAVALAQPGFREDHDHRHGPHRHGPGGPRGRRGPFGPPPPPPPPPGRPGPRPGPPGGPGEEGDHILFCIDSGTGRTVIYRSLTTGPQFSCWLVPSSSSSVQQSNVTAERAEKE
ncbi:hypothetical protein TYRP_013733 [Tyrophagus putrescentiae]|nr:hypothetical protein TYRP_013733 [Tyrophagus putrescentiae]